MGKRELVKQRRKQQQANKNLTAMLIVGALIVVVVAIVIATQYKPVGAINSSDRVYTMDKNSLTLGNADAPVKSWNLLIFNALLVKLLAFP